jgi:hypothetical protein
MAAAIGVEARGQSMRREHLEQCVERRSGPFLLDEKRRIDLTRGIVHRDDQIELGLSLKPRKATAILVQHHSNAGLAWSLAPMRAAAWSGAHKTRRMQLRLHPRVAPAKIMLLLHMLVEMLDRPAGVSGAVLP